MKANQQPPSNGSGEEQRPIVVDRHNTVIGKKADSSPSLGNGPVEVELTEPLQGLLDPKTESIRVPLDWVDGFRRDEIRLSLGLGDRAFISFVDQNEKGHRFLADPTRR